jgi:hypothetical protein
MLFVDFLVIFKHLHLSCDANDTAAASIAFDVVHNVKKI